MSCLARETIQRVHCNPICSECFVTSLRLLILRLRGCCWCGDGNDGSLSGSTERAKVEGVRRVARDERQPQNHDDQQDDENDESPVGLRTRLVRNRSGLPSLRAHATTTVHDRRGAEYFRVCTNFNRMQRFKLFKPPTDLVRVCVCLFGLYATSFALDVRR